MRRGLSLWWIIIVVLVLMVAGILIYLNFRPAPKGQGTTTPSSSEQTSAQTERKFLALGSSGSQANNLSSEKVGDNPDFSFSTGQNLDSFFKYLKSTGENLTAINLASSGATMAEILSKQVSNAKDYHPKFITLDPGADLVMSTAVATYKEILDKVLQELKKDDTVILMANYPNFIKMRTASFASCKENKLGVNLDGLTENNINSFNQTIKEVADRYQIAVVDLYNLLDSNDVSDYDCIHPNLEGQKKMAQAFINSYKSLAIR